MPGTGIDPISIATSATGAGIGALQGLISSFGAGKAQKKLERMINDYQPSQSIRDFYSKALQKYNANPYTSPLYNYASNQARAGTAQGINAFQDRRSANANISTLIQGQNDALLKAAATAEGQQGQALGQLGTATQMKDREDKYKFENMYNLLAAKAGAKNQTANTGFSNIYSGLGNISNYYTAKQAYKE